VTVFRNTSISPTNFTWLREATLGPSAGPGGTRFGEAVAMEGIVLLVGSPDFDILTAGQSGRVQVFTFQGTWTPGELIESASPTSDANFGRAVAISGGQTVIGEPGFDGLTGTNSGRAVFGSVATGAPAATIAPAVTDLCPGGPSRQITASLTNSNSPSYYSWFRNNTLISPATNPSAATAVLQLAPTAASAGTYRCEVGNICGNSLTNTVTVNFNATDFNCNGTKEPADIFAFLNLYFVGNPITDFNGDGSRTPTDIFAFLTAYFAP
jgi:hypothetical protein